MQNTVETSGKIYPLSLNQYGLWFFDRLVPNSPLYSVPWICRIKGDLDLDALQNALQTVWERHDVLRSRIKMANDKAFVTVFHGLPLPFEIVDFTAQVAPEAIEEQVNQSLLEHAVQPFDLYNDVLMRSILFKCAADQYILFFNMHHIVFDGWSMEILLREIAEVYNAQVDGTVASLPALENSFFDFSKWHKKLVQSEGKEQLFEFWKNKIKESLVGSQFPNDMERKLEQSYKGKILTVKLPNQLSDKILEVAKKERATPNMMFLAGLKALLHKYTGSTEILVGSPMAGRSKSEFESIIGYLVNLVPLKTDLQENMTFKQLLRGVRRTTLEAFMNQDMPLDTIVSELLPERNSNESLIHTVFAYEDDATLGIKMSGVELTPIEGLPTSTSKFDTTWTITNKGEFFELNVEFATDLFEETTIQRLMQQYEYLLENLVDSPEVELSQISMLTPEEIATYTSGNVVILNDRLQLVPVGVPGDLYLSQVTLDSNFMRQHAEIEKHLIENPLQAGSQLLRTGRAKWKADGSVHILELFGFRPNDENESAENDESEEQHDVLESVTGKEIKAIWEEVLEIEDVKPSDNFFRLGGHSLSAIQIIVRVRESFGIDVPLRSLFEAEDIVQFIADVEHFFALDHDNQASDDEVGVVES